MTVVPQNDIYSSVQYVCMSDASRLFEALANDIRRRLLFRLCEGETIGIPEGAKPDGESDYPSHEGDKWIRDGGQTVVAHRSPSRSLTDGREGSTSLDIELWHVHLPKLQEGGFITWEKELERISRGPKFETIEPALRAIISNAEAFPDDL